MIETSEAYKEIMESNVRPKCEPTITVSGIDNTGNNISLTWGPSNIQELKYKRSCDIIGKNLPYMQLEWTELYTGKLNEEYYPEKYNNVTKYMAVDVTFKQSLGFFNTWKLLYQNQLSWKEIFNKTLTWRQIFNSVASEEIKLPRMFLEARPTISGGKIKWVAKDLMYFLDFQQTKAFYKGIPYYNPLIWLLVDSRGIFKNNPEMYETLNASVQNLKNLSETSSLTLDADIIMDGTTKDIIKNYASLLNRWIDFDNEGKIVVKYDDNFGVLPSTYAQHYTSILMYDFPEITNGTDISAYNFKNYELTVDTVETYTVTPYLYTTFQGQNIYRGDYKKYGRATSLEVAEEIGYFIAINQNPITVNPVEYRGFDNSISNSEIGEIFNEDNPINPFSSQSEIQKSRFTRLKKYYNKNCASLSFQGLANPAIETGVYIQIDTNLYDNSGEKIVKNALVVEIEIEYNGSMKEKIIAHEVVES